MLCHNGERRSVCQPALRLARAPLAESGESAQLQTAEASQRGRHWGHLTIYAPWARRDETRRDAAQQVLRNISIFLSYSLSFN